MKNLGLLAMGQPVQPKVRILCTQISIYFNLKQI